MFWFGDLTRLVHLERSNRELSTTIGVAFEQRQALERRVEELKGEVTYWRTRCERLVDAALSKKGEINAPVMVETRASRGGPLGDLLEGPLAGLGVTSITGTPRDKKANLSLPGQAMSTSAADSD